MEQSLAEVEEYSQAVSHDLRAPLRAMQGLCDVLLQDYRDKLDSDGLEYLRRIKLASEGLGHMVEDLLQRAQASQEPARLYPVRLEEVVRKIIAQNPSLQPPKAVITLRTPLPIVLADEALLTQCFANLLANAVKFVNRGVVPRVTIRAERAGMHTRIWVQDNGIGISPGDAPHIFDKFRRAHKHDYEGSGLGLSFVQKAVARMRGAVGVHSNAGKGSSFWIQLRRKHAE